MHKVEIYIDGSCSGNPGPGGWAAVCELNGKKLASCGFVAEKTTNNRMELSGALGGIQALRRPCEVTLYTDSAYLITCAKHNDAWLTEASRSNSDLWIELIKAAKKGGHKIKFVKIKGHSGERLNELADKLAKAQCVKAKHVLYKTGG